MPSFESPLLYIDFARLPPPAVIENIDFEVILDRYKTQVSTRAIARGLPSLAAALKLEQSPQSIILEAQSYGEMIVRSRVNAAARAVMLPFSTGTDLDNLAAFYNVQRAIITPATPTTPAVYETDDRLLKKVRLAAEAFSTAGTAGSYIFHALEADPTIRDVSAIKLGPGMVGVYLMNSGTNPAASEDQVNAVWDKLMLPNIKPLTDVLSVGTATPIEADIVATIELYPGPDASMVIADVNAALVRLRDRVAAIGRDLSRSSILAALTQEGVRSVSLTSPAQDVIVSASQAVWIKTASVSVSPYRSE